MTSSYEYDYDGRLTQVTDPSGRVVIGRKEGATIGEIAKATAWQNHSIRGFLSAHVGKKMGLKVESEKNEAGERVYRIG